METVTDKHEKNNWEPSYMMTPKFKSEVKKEIKRIFAQFRKENRKAFDEFRSIIKEEIV